MPRMTPTNHSTLTPEGTERKLQRLIVRALKREHPFIYAQLEAAALEVVNFDRLNPFATHVGTSRTRETMKRANRTKLMHQAAAIAHRFHPTFTEDKKTTLTVKEK